MDLELMKSLPDSKNVKLFPVIPNGKTPAVQEWQARASSAWDRLGWLPTGNYNAGVFTGRYRVSEALLVIDVDVKKGKDGERALALFQMMHDDLPATYEVRTPTGGRHLYFRTSAKVASGVDVLGEGLDIRSQGGYVVAPGSSTPEGEYTVAQDAPIAEAPDWLITEIKSRAKHRNPEQAAVTELDQPFNINRATDYLERTAPAIQGQGGDTLTYQTAAMVKDFGISRSLCQALIEEHFNPRCSPPWEPEALAVKVNSAYANGQNAPGSKGVDASWAEPVDMGEAPAPATQDGPKPLPIVHFNACKPDLNRVDLIEGMLSKGAMSVMFGESNAGKTFVAVDMAWHIAAGWDWMGRKVSQGPTVIIAAEGGGGISSRMAALQIEFADRLKEEGRALDDVPLYVIPASVDLRSNYDDAVRVKNAIFGIQLRHRAGVELVVIDTLSRAMAGGDENGPKDMGAYIATVDLLRHATRAHAMSVHHCGKDSERGARGHSSLRAAVDTEIEVVSNTIHTVKQREMEFSRPLGFDLKVITLGVNPYGKNITSCVIQPAEASAPEVKAGKTSKRKLPDRALFMLDAFNGALDKARSDGLNFITMDKWRDYTRDMGKSAAADRVKMGDEALRDNNAWLGNFRRAVKQLVEAKCIMEMQEDQWVSLG
jgi:hypothetical protein